MQLQRNLMRSMQMMRITQCKGNRLEDDYTRLYPYNRLASSTIGFTNSEGEGSFGIENAYNAVLSGTDGREYGYFDSGSPLQQSNTVKASKEWRYGCDDH